jgi:16S rRNA (cytosine1402-N4)-methyltransferase
LGISRVDRLLLDLGVSSDQIADESRGFSFRSTGPLDLRFDRSAGIPAWELLAELDEFALKSLLHDYGEERCSGSIARAIVRRQAEKPIQTAADLVEAVNDGLPASARKHSGTHPATRVFQALRIAVNGELDHLKGALDRTVHECLAPGGIAAVITFHSLEDRLVKREFRRTDRWQNLTPKPLTPSAVEKRMNPRCRTAKLRAARKP